MATPPIHETPPAEDAPPIGGIQRVGRAAAAIAAVTADEGGAEAGDLAQKVSQPIPIYALGTPDKASDPATLLHRAKRFGWRYLVLGAGPDVADLSDGGTPVLDQSPGFAERITRAGALAQREVSDDPSYGIRLLDLSLIGRSFVWAASSDPAKPDRLFNLDDEPKEVDLADTLEQVSEAERQKAVAYENACDEAGGSGERA